MALRDSTSQQVGRNVSVKFEVYSDGTWWCGRGIGVDIFTQGKTFEALLENIREAVQLHFDDEL